MANSLAASIISSGNKTVCVMLVYHMPDWASELLDLPARHDILIAQGNQEILTIEMLMSSL